MEQYIELTNRVGLGGSAIIPQIFKMIANEEEAELLLAMPGQVPTLAEKMGKPEQEVADMVQTLFIKGLVFPSRKTDPPTYRMCRDMIQLHDATILWPDAPREFLDLWQEWTEQEWPTLAVTYAQLLPAPGMRVIPVGITVQAHGKVLAFEDVREIINNANKLAVTKCTCRLAAHKCDRELENCIQVNHAASYAVARGTGRELTKAEAIEVVRKAEEEGLIHTSFNQKTIDHVICNCCGDCCQFLPVLIKYGTAVAAPSRFSAVVDESLCSACEICLDRCYFGAITIEDTAVVNAEKCLGCGLCQVTCPEGAIALEEIREPDFVPDKLM